MSRGGHAKQISAILGAILFFYVASTGPVIAYLEHTADQTSAPHRAESLRLMYYPLVSMAKGVPPIQRAFTWYIRLWEKTLYNEERS